MTTREDLLDRFRSEQRNWRALVDEVGRDRMNEPGPMGDWTFRDLVSHLAGWRNRTIGRVEALARGEPQPPDPWPSELQDEDPINEWIRARDAGRSLDDVLDDYDSAFDRLATALIALPDEVLMTPGAVAWLPDEALSETDWFGHLHDEHEPSIREWLATRG
jgi:hypothetical protein